MLIRKLALPATFMLAALLFENPRFALGAPPAPAITKQRVEVGTTPVASATKQEPKTFGKRPLRIVARPGWLGSLVGESLFLARLGTAFDRLDKNKDGFIKWAVIDAKGKMQIDKPGAEPLPASYDACYLIDYVHHPANTEKDPAHPGKYLEESYEITGWKTWKEALAELNSKGYPALSPTGVCNKMGKVPYCKKGGYETQRVCVTTYTGCNCYYGVDGFTIISKDACVDEQKVPTAFTKDQWMKVAKDHFKREDWNHDGKLDAVESKEFICPGE